MNLSSSAASSIPVVGVFPSSFPRDPVEINIFLEHILVGQILEPLVESGTDGAIAPGVASRWKVENGGKVIHFHVRDGLKFSTGRPVTAEDVRYTLQRHIDSPNSQSKAYLRRILRMSVVSSQEIVFYLAEPYVAIFKALSRDQLGIVPAGWKFNPNADEPYIGTGAYRAVRSKGEWRLVRNSNFWDLNRVAVPEWQVQFAGDSSSVPDLVPFAFTQYAGVIEDSALKKGSALVREPVTHFFQSSAWWYPHGFTFEDDRRRAAGMSAIADLIEIRRKKLGLVQVTGLIPDGISGHLPEPALPQFAPGKPPTNQVYTVAVLAREYQNLFDAADVSAIEQKHHLQLKFNKFEAPEFASLTKKRPDILMFAFAGGFHDPEGFLTVVTAMLCADLKIVLGEKYDLYNRAATDPNWNTRSLKYQELNRSLLLSGQVVPGWRVEAIRLRSDRLQLTADDLRYSPKLKDYQLRKEER